MGHHNHDSLRRMVKKGHLEHIEAVSGEDKFCEPCIRAKMKKLHLSRKGHNSASRPLQIIHSDVGGPVNVKSRSGHRYWITFVDEYTRFTWVYFLKAKSEAEKTYDKWRADIVAFFGAEIGEIQF